jgi:phenylacetate-CoA ligase
LSHRIDGVYERLPLPLQNLAISLFGIGWRAERLGGAFDRYAREFRDRESWPADRFRDYVDRSLRETLLRAFERTPYYSAAWREQGFSAAQLAKMTQEELRRLPVTPRSALRQRPLDFLASDRRGRLRSFPTSGSTGTPVRTMCTAEDRRRFYAGREARSFQWAGASIRMPRSMIGGRKVVPADARAPYYRVNAAERQMYCSAFHISASTAAAYVNGFNRRRPEVFTGYAYAHFLLARLMLDQGLRLDYEPRALILGSEKLTADMKEAIHAAFGARAYEEYGTTENCVLATECERGRLHVSPEFGILEIVGEDGQPLPAGQEGRILCTGLLNRTQPLVRYEIGDRGVWASGGCECGRTHLPVLHEIVGRIEDVVVGPGGRQLVRFHFLYYDLPSIVEGQVIQEAVDRIRVRVVAGAGFTGREFGLIEGRLKDRLGRIQVSCECVPAIERTSRGKFKAVVSLLTPEERARAAAGH